MDEAGKKTYRDLPAAARRFLGDFDAVAYVDGLVRKYTGTDQVKKVSDVIVAVRQVASGEARLEGLPAALSALLQIDETLARSLSVDLAIHRLLPVSELIGIDVASQLRAWGADPARYADVKQVSAESPAPKEEPERAPIVDTGAVFSDPILQHRLELIVDSYLSGVRTREQAVAVLMRSIKTGGLEMNEANASAVLDLAHAAPKSAAETEIALEKEAPASASKEPAVPLAPVGVPTPDAAGATEPHPDLASVIAPAEDSVPKPAPDTFRPEDEEEIKTVAAQKKEVLDQPALITDTGVAAETIAQNAGVTFATGELKTRFEHIIDARLRDVRDGFETRAKLEASVEQGGLGLSGAQLVAVVEATERMDELHHKALALQMGQKKEEMKVAKAQVAQKAEQTAAQEAQVMAKRYAEITGKAPTELVEPAAPSGARSTAAVPADQMLAARERAIDTGKVRAAIEAAKAPSAPAPAVMSEASIPAAPSGRPKVEDIRFERKLAGPVEELRLLTLVDFRRLSKDPKQAAGRVRDKVELVSQEGYDHRIAAIRAWRESPLSRMYVALSREALLNGKGISQILAEKRSVGEDVPSDEELHAIVELNGILRF